MGKILIWIVVVFAILFVLRLVNVAKARRDREDARDEPKGKPSERTTSGPMVRCVECGTFVPKTDAHPVPQGFVCSDAKCVQRRGSRRS